MNVVILGGGPVGLLCAIEAKQHFANVWVIEKRSGYSRMNVPQIRDVPLQQQLTSLGVEEQGTCLNYGSFKEIETGLLATAKSQGVKLLRPYALRYLRGEGEKKGDRYAQVNLICWKWDDEKKTYAPGGECEMITADLVVVATGAGAAEDRVITSELGFTYEKLKPKNYMAYGIFELEQEVPGIDRDSPGYVDYKAQLTKDSDAIAGVGNFTPRQEEYQYFLTSLAGITAQDFKEIKTHRAKLEQLLVALKSGESMAEGVRESLKQVERNVLAFKICIQRARQFYSPIYPAVMVGDAAVTPHPDTASGYSSGFNGCQELKKLYEALANTKAPKDISTIYQTFNDRYEMHVSQKAIEGTTTILTHNIRLLETYIADLRSMMSKTTSATVIRVYDIQTKTATRLKTKLLQQQAQVEGFKASYKCNSGANPNPPSWDATVGKLWKDLEISWFQIKAITSDHSTLVEKIATLENHTKSAAELQSAFPAGS